MRFNWFENTSEGTKFVLSIALMMGFLITGMLLSILFTIPFFGIEAIPQINKSANISLLKFHQAIQSIFLFVLPPIFLSILFGEKPSVYLKFNFKPEVKYILVGVILIITILPIINYTQLINNKLDLPEYLSGLELWMRNTEEYVNKLTEEFLKTSSIMGLMVNIFVMAVIPAIGEELTFRGLFQNIFIRWFKNYHVGVWISAILFSAIHFQFFGFLPRLLLGLIFGYVVVWTGNILYAIVMHFINNFIGIVVYYFYFRGKISFNPDTVGIEGNSIGLYLIFSLVISSGLFYLFYRKYFLSRSEME